LPNFNSKCFRKLVSLGARDFTEIKKKVSVSYGKAVGGMW
jgi:hypothetical protein